MCTFALLESVKYNSTYAAKNLGALSPEISIIDDNVAKDNRDR